MPVYEYLCPACTQRFSHLWRTMAAAASEPTPACPSCTHKPCQRLLSQVAVLGSLGGLTPTEQAGVKAEAERIASITPRDQIDKLQQTKQATDRAARA